MNSSWIDQLFFLDLETRSEVDLEKVGVVNYACHPSTEIMCASFAKGDEPVRRWLETDDTGLLETVPELSKAELLKCFHNISFEYYILRYVAGLEIPVEEMVDSAAAARAYGLPGALEPLGAFFGYDKDMEGNRIMLKLSKPRRPSKDNSDLFWRPNTKPDDFNRLYKYCDRDVKVARHAMKNIPPLSPRERAIFSATFKMNKRGMPFDRTAAEQMKAAADAHKTRLSDEIDAEFGFTLSQPAKIAEFLGIDSVAKAPLRDLLKDETLPPDQYKVARYRQEFAKTSMNKVTTMLRLATEQDKIHEGFMYAGAERTMRFSGRGMQPQNLPRGMGAKQDAAFTLLDQGLFDYCYDGLPDLADMIRGLIRAPMCIGDYSQIEARLLAWLSDDQETLDVFRAGGDPYKRMAAAIYHKPVAQITANERFMGKQTVLGCGYGLGRYGFQSMLDMTYDVQISDNEAQSTVTAYRKNSPKVVKFWDRIGRAVSFAYKNVGKVVPVNDHVKFIFKEENLFQIILPSGRRLTYHHMRYTNKSWHAFGRFPSGAGYGPVKIYPGKLCGHITQSAARDIVADALVRLDAAKFDLIMTVHDENVAIDPSRFEEFEMIMSSPPDWLTNFPLDVDAFTTERYRK